MKAPVAPFSLQRYCLLTAATSWVSNAIMMLLSSWSQPGAETLVKFVHNGSTSAGAIVRRV